MPLLNCRARTLLVSFEIFVGRPIFGAGMFSLSMFLILRAELMETLRLLATSRADLPCRSCCLTLLMVSSARGFISIVDGERWELEGMEWTRVFQGNIIKSSRAR